MGAFGLGWVFMRRVESKLPAIVAVDFEKLIFLCQFVETPPFARQLARVKQRRLRVIDVVMRHLELASQFEENARRLVESRDKGPNWTNAYNRSLADARRARELARKIAQGLEVDSMVGHAKRSERRANRSRKADVRRVTIGQILRLASIIESSSPGTARLRRAASRMKEIVAILEGSAVLSQFMWWARDMSPVPPGRCGEPMTEICAGRVLQFGIRIPERPRHDAVRTATESASSPA
jgi:hypothetical protein